MLDDIYLYNFSHHLTTSMTGIKASKGQESTERELFLLNTCQRKLILSEIALEVEQKHQFFHGQSAYQYLLEVICGLQSQMVGEHEIVCQFKQAYDSYLKHGNKSKKIILLLEKLFKDAKEIRTEYLGHLSKSSYASVAKKMMVGLMPKTPIVIIGTGQLAEDFIFYFRKNFPIILCARNQQKASELAANHDLKVIPWEKLPDLHTYPIILNTIGVSQLILFSSEFMQRWDQYHVNQLHYFVDFGSPSSVNGNGIKPYIPLTELLAQGAILDHYKVEKVQQAKRHLEEIAQKRTLWFDLKYQRDLHYLQQSL
jgi:glutamyl-tRNA reductase